MYKRWEGTFAIEKLLREQVWVTDGSKNKQFSRTESISDPEDPSDRQISHLQERFQNMKIEGLPGVHVTDVLAPSEKRKTTQSLIFLRPQRSAG